jgi:Protein kinase domain
MLIADRYREIRRLGAGGSATVVLAEDRELGREVALKRLHSDDDPDVVKRFTREAKLGASLSHPNVVSVYDALLEEERVLLVMEYVPGESLADMLKRGRLSPQRALEILEPLAEALDHSHAHGVVHRDVKPANVIIRDDGVVKLADLGIATSVDQTRITREGMAVGTVGYMAPEQLEGSRVTRAADVFALGAVAFEALSGRRARSGETPAAIMHEIANLPPPDLRDAWPEAPQRAVEVIAAALDPDPARRPKSAGALVRSLRAAFEERPSPRRPIPPKAGATVRRAPAKARAGTGVRAPVAGRGRWLGALVLLAGALALGVVLLTSGDEASRPEGPAETRDGEAQGGAAGAEGPVETAEGSPAAAVMDFYELAADGEFQSAWALAGEGFRSQLQGFAAFQSQFSSLESINFERAETINETPDAATVAIATSAVHTDKVDSCSGEVSLGPGGEAGWVIERIGVDCTSTPR